MNGSSYKEDRGERMCFVHYVHFTGERLNVVISMYFSCNSNKYLLAMAELCMISVYNIISSKDTSTRKNTTLISQFG